MKGRHRQSLLMQVWRAHLGDDEPLDHGARPSLRFQTLLRQGVLRPSAPIVQLHRLLSLTYPWRGTGRNKLKMGMTTVQLLRGLRRFHPHQKTGLVMGHTRVVLQERKQEKMEIGLLKGRWSTSTRPRTRRQKTSQRTLGRPPQEPIAQGLQEPRAPARNDARTEATLESEFDTSNVFCCLLRVL